MGLFKTILQRTAGANKSSQDGVRRHGYMLRGSLVGLALLPAYFAVTLSIPSANQIIPAMTGMAILAIFGAVIGYSMGNLANFFDFSMPAGFLNNSGTTAAEPSAKHDEISSFDWGCPNPAEPFEPRRWDDNERETRFIVSGDWRDEYSTPSSREDDARRDGFS